MRLSLAGLLLSFSSACAYGASIAADLSGVKPGPIAVTSSAASVQVSWSDAANHQWQTTFSLDSTKPLITAISVDVFKTVPPVLKEAAYGVGCTTWEVVRNVVIPYTRVGVIGGVMLALGRALGETMAVTFIIGNSFRISSSIFAPGTTISAAIASEFAESDGLHQSALILLGLLLFVLTFFVLAAARLMLMRLEKKAGN